MARAPKSDRRDRDRSREESEFVETLTWGRVYLDILRYYATVVR